MSNKSDSEDTFEDAVDTLAVLTSSSPSASTFFRSSCSVQNSFPPPIGPPPPLPEHLASPLDEILPSLPISPNSTNPPPLPPRRPLPKNMEPQNSTTTCITATTTKSPDQQLYGRQRGHAKTNSLDRGLSLAKCMKTGPFPPPTASKSNSLTRGASPSDLPVLDEQDTQAQGVIQGVIQQVLDNSSDNEEIENGERSHPEDVASTSASLLPTSAKSSSSSIQRKIKLTAESKEGVKAPYFHKKSISVPQYENVTDSVSVSSPNIVRPRKYASDSNDQRLTLAGNSKKRIDERQHRRHASDKSPAKVTSTPSSQKSSTWDRSMGPTKSESIDPITRDVERRMSLKDKQLSLSASKHENDGNDASSSDDVFGQRHSNVDYIRQFARNYGSAASDYLRDTVQKVRQRATNLKKNAVKSKKKEIFGTDNDKDAASSIADIDEMSIAQCISDSLTVTGSNPINRKIRAINSEEPRASVRNSSISVAATAAAPIAPTTICRPKNAKKGPFDFEQLQLAQELNHEHTGAIWCVRFSYCGRLLATAGQDRNVRVWVLRSHLNYFSSLRERYGQEADNLDYSAMQHIENMRPELYDESSEYGTQEKRSVSSPENAASATNIRRSSAALGMPAPPLSSRGKPTSSSSMIPSSSSSSSSSSFPASVRQTDSSHGAATFNSEACNIDKTRKPAFPTIAIFSPKPFCVFRGHTADVLDLGWSPRNFFILSGGMDRTVKLWHLTRNECLCSFQHVDFVTCIAFMPKDERYFISGSLDGKIRLWNIPEKRVAIWNEVEEVVKFITAITFVKNGKFVVVGTYSGRCFFYSTDQLKYHTVIDVRSSKGKNSRGRSHKITSLAVHGDKLLVASNDSRIRIYDLRDMDLCCKFKGAQIEQSHIRASFSPDGKHIVSGSEDNFIYIWRTYGLPSSLTVRKDRKHAWERVRAHQAAVTTAVFAPKPQLGDVIVSADLCGSLKVFVNPLFTTQQRP